MAPKNGVPKTYVKYPRVPRRTRSPDGRGCPVTRYPGIPVSRFPGIPVSRPPNPNRKSQIRKSAIADLLAPPSPRNQATRHAIRDSI